MSKFSAGIDIVDMGTGRQVIQLRDRNIDTVIDCCFSRDGNAAAVHWRKGSESATRDSIRIIEVPSGRELRRFDLPVRSWHHVNEWVENRLYLEADVPGGASGYYLRESYSFDLTANAIGDGRPEPLLSGRSDGETYWDHGSGWIVHISLGPREIKKWEEWLEWLARKLGTTFQAERPLCNRVRFLDPDSGRLRYELPSSMKYPCIISHDGKRVASIEPRGILEVWDADPSPRWPWAVTAGIAGAVPILIVGRWRSYRRPAAAKSADGTLQTTPYNANNHVPLERLQATLSSEPWSQGPTHEDSDVVLHRHPLLCLPAFDG
jgi:hypothetical protein